MRAGFERDDPAIVRVVSEVARKTLAELAITLAIGAICLPFVATYAGVAFMALSAAIQFPFNFKMRIVAKINPDFPSLIPQALFEITTMHRFMTLIHEAGHAIAMRALISGAKTQIVLNDFAGGSTTLFPSRPYQATPLGAMIGLKRIQPCISAAGPALSLAVSTIAFASSFALEPHYPELSRTCYYSSMFDFSIHAFYALSATWEDPVKSSHDFTVLAQHGISPIACTVAICAIPILISLAHKTNQD